MDLSKAAISISEGLKAKSYEASDHLPTSITSPAGRYVRPAIATVYRSVVNRLVPSTWEIATNGLTIRFRISDVDEYRQFRRFPEKDTSFPLPGDLLSRLRPDDVFWDIGANVGIYTCFAAATLPPGRVVSIEPNPNNVARITENLRLNGLTADVHQRALMEVPGELTLEITDQVDAGAYGRIAEDPSSGITVQGTTGDRLVDAGVPTPTVVKLDVQGAELEALRGMEDVLSSPDCRLVYADVITAGSGGYYKDKSNGDAERQWLEDRGFEVERLYEWEDGHFIRAQRPGEGSRDGKRDVLEPSVS
jgi:FkbM family methyltransferase